MEKQILSQGAEAIVYLEEFKGKLVIVKERFIKKYRVPELDEKITKSRIKQETRNMERLEKSGVHTPKILHSDLTSRKIIFEYLAPPCITVKNLLLKYDQYYTLPQIYDQLVTLIAEAVAKTH